MLFISGLNSFGESMVDFISGSASANAAISTLLRAQTVGVNNLKMNQQASQAIINQLQKNVPSNSSSASFMVASAPVSSGGNGGGSLPRGSLVDVVV